MSKRIAFLGLGTMGAPMASHLARAGHRVTVYNRTAARAELWLERHAVFDVSVAANAAEAARGQDAVVTCVGNDDDLDQVVLGPTGALPAMAPGALLIDHTTVSPALARRIAGEAEAAGVLALDAPVSGGQAGAEGGKLSIMCGGTAVAMERARSILECYSARIVHIGEAGAGQAAKAVNQLCIAGTLGGLSEGLRFAQAAGLDLGFAIDWMRKDLAIALGEAKVMGLPLPIAALVDQFYGAVQAQGHGRQDTSALVRHLPEVKP
jgi:3-hydroxyisobutyrate dehydrogenase